VGDSYAAGLGSGSRVEYSCSRYNGAYPTLIERDDRFGSNPNRTFQYLACSGVKSTDVLKKQVPHLKPGLDLITLSAGGNDVALGDVLDACIFQWRHGSSVQCEMALNRSQTLIDTILTPNVEALLDALTEKLSPAGSIYYPGYAQFFGESRNCENISWSVWPRMPTSDKQNLTLARRIRMNDMVAQVNQKIKAVVKKAGPRVVFIDWDWTFTQAGGRFCEESVLEPDPSRAGLLFYQWNTLEDGEDERMLDRPGDPVPKDTFEGDISKWVAETLREHPDWEFGPAGSTPIPLKLDHSAQHKFHDELRPYLGFDDAVFWFLPDSWKRVFHPRAMGHHIIADMMLHDMHLRRAEFLALQHSARPTLKGLVVQG
jgi:hypothetical protein